jgi:uncharacterized sporulation protein YeaH/YhbH (DUF444 family)
MARIAADRFLTSQWNIYAAQASDGDNTSTDNAKAAALLKMSILPLCQYYAYLEVGRSVDETFEIGSKVASSLWRTYEPIAAPRIPMAMRKVHDRKDIYPVFRELFERRADAVPAMVR